MKLLRRSAHPARSGSVTAVVACIVLLLGGSVSAFFMLTSATQRMVRREAELTQARYLAESAIHEAAANFAAGGRDQVDSLVYPQEFEGNQYACSAEWGEDSASMDDDLVCFVGTGSAGRADITVQGLFRRSSSSSVLGVAADVVVTMDSNSYVDSYDSSAGTYASQALSRWKGTAYADTNAPLLCNGDIQMDSNSSIWGDATPGPSGSTSISNNCTVYGSTTPMLQKVAMPSISVPSLPSAGRISLDSGTRRIPAGDYHYRQLEMKSTGVLTIEGPARLVIDDVEILSNSEVWIDNSAGAVEIWVTGYYEQNSNTIVAPQDYNPSGLRLYIDGRNPSVLMDSNAELHAIVEAPSRTFEIKSNSELYGSISASELHLNSNAGVHFDENLNSSGGSGGSLELLAWRQIGNE